MLERLLPHIVACAETRQHLLEVDLFPVERRALGRAVEKRRREFLTGRGCARMALRRLGAPAMAVPSGQRGEPLWPAGVVGSITHCDGYGACAVTWSEAMISLGIDAEPNAPLPASVLGEVAHGREREWVGAGATEVDLGRLLFSAKEAVYKAWFPLARSWLGFADAELSFDLAKGEFNAELLVPGPIVNGSRITGFRGRWAVEDGIICTAVAVPAAGPRAGDRGPAPISQAAASGKCPSAR